MEIESFKKFREHYKSLLARSTQFHIELELIKLLTRKCNFIDWRDKLEEIMEKLKNGDRVTLDHM